MVRFWDSPCGPQSRPWSFASVASEMPALFKAVIADAGASKTYGFDCGSGQVLSVTTVSRFTMLAWVPANSCGIVVPRAVEGSWASFEPTTPSKCTSPPKPRVTGWPLPFQAGLSGECAGKWAAAVVVWCCVVEGGGGALPEPPEMNAK